VGPPELAQRTWIAPGRPLWGRDAIVRLAGPLARAISALSDDERRATREAITENMAPFPNEDGSYTAPASTWVVLAR
jgi:hypothetical protein